MIANRTLAPPRAQSALEGESFHTWTFPDGTPWTEFHRADGGYLLRFPGLADFPVSADALHVTGCPAPEVSEATVQHLYLNQVLPLVLSKQGQRVFHASAVEIGEGAVVFAAERRFSHSTWQGMLLVPEDLIRAKPERVPRLSREGQARLTVLQYCDGERSARDIERAVLSDHPALFPSPQEISRFVMQVLGRDTE